MNWTIELLSKSDSANPQGLGRGRAELSAKRNGPAGGKPNRPFALLGS
jgi:hypothetical protein